MRWQCKTTTVIIVHLPAAKWRGELFLPAVSLALTFAGFTSFLTLVMSPFRQAWKSSLWGSLLLDELGKKGSPTLRFAILTFSQWPSEISNKLVIARDAITWILTISHFVRCIQLHSILLRKRDNLVKIHLLALAVTSPTPEVYGKYLVQ